MEMKSMETTMPRQSMIYLGLCLFGVLLFILLGVIPSAFSLNALERKIGDIKFQIEEQKVLAPLYKSASSLPRKKGPVALPMPAPERLETSRMHMIPERIGQIARDNNMGILSVSPDLKTITEDGQRLSVEVTVRGDFVNLRKFLLDLNSVPYVESTKEINVQQEKNAQLFRIKLWIAVA
ncbi:MAG: hypothetical protein C0394_00635 [Syntrophus sp. (in: bacteria)]|nr:hypothetical protein [Syntrophus sp. (in: bacteria)]